MKSNGNLFQFDVQLKSDEDSAVGVSGATTTSGHDSGRGNSKDGGSGGNMFNLRSLFTKKSIVFSPIKLTYLANREDVLLLGTGRGKKKKTV
ncbi:hypothetical protein Lal_00043151 [Lupinus albus]|nr:hypothetical protein Lal_00043151 [Lupinus albus]